MARALVLALLLYAVAVAGCGGTADSAQDFEGAEQEVAQAIEDLEEAGQEDEPRRICQALLSRELVERIEAPEAGDCEKAIDKALDETDTFSLTVEEVRVTGTTARARVETGVDEEKIETIELVLENKAWRIAGLPGSA